MQFQFTLKNVMLTNAFFRLGNQRSKPCLSAQNLAQNLTQNLAQPKRDHGFNISAIENLSPEFLSLDFQLIHKAIKCAKEYHSTQKRQTGEPYYRHPLSVADIAIKHFCETNVVLCSILHDTLEDTKLTREHIKKEFNATTLNCVVLLTNQKGETLEQRVNHILDNTYKLKPPRADRTLTVKLADRLHNMQSLHIKTRDKQRRIAAETLDILVPIANDLKLFDICKQLQALCDKYK